MGIHKKFDKDLYKKYNEAGIQAVLSYLEDLDIYARKGDDKYGVDIVTFSGIRPAAYIEVEVVSGWREGAFPWPYCHVLERKAKWMLQGIGLPVTLYRVRADLQAAIMIPDYTLDLGQLAEVPNVLVAEGEYMYRVPTEELEQVDLKD